VKMNTGSDCQNDSDCSLNLCRQNKCCNRDCNGICERCDVQNLFGTCTSLSKTTACVAGSCTGIIWQPPTLCDGQGACPTNPPTPVDCEPYKCDQTNAVCYNSCPIGNECAPGWACDMGDHKCKLDIGQKCTYATDCASGFCADGYCCNDKCDGACEACNLDQTIGTCTAIGLNQTDPHSKCTDASVCGDTGKCKGGNKGSGRLPETRQQYGLRSTSLCQRYPAFCSELRRVGKLSGRHDTGLLALPL